MKVGKIYRDSTILIENCWCADTVMTRARGLLARPPLAINEGLMIAPCSSIHTFGMKYPLDIVFVDSAGKIVKMCKNLAKWRVAAAFNAAWTLELFAGEVERLQLTVGQQLQWRPV